MALGDVSGHVHAGKIEWHAAPAGALQRGQAVADLFETGIKAFAHLVHVVAQFTRGLQKAAIGHQDGPRRIVGQTDPADIGSRSQLEIGPCQFFLDQIGKTDQRQLVRHLETACHHRQGWLDIENTRSGIVASHRPVLIGDTHTAQIAQGLFKRPFGMAGPVDVYALGQLFGGQIKRVDIVVAIVEEVAHRLIGQGRGRQLFLVAAQRLVQGLQAIIQTAIVLMQLQKQAGHAWAVIDRLFQLGGRWRLGSCRHIGDRFAQVGDQAGISLQIEQAGIHIKGAGERDQNAGGGRSLIGFDL